MNNNKIIELTDKCVYLGIPLHACTLNSDMSSTVRALIGMLTIYLLISQLLIAIHYLYYLILTVCLYMKVNCVNYMIKIV